MLRIGCFDETHNTYHTMKLNPQLNPFEADPRWLAEALVLLVVFFIGKMAGLFVLFLKAPPVGFVCCFCM